MRDGGEHFAVRVVGVQGRVLRTRQFQRDLREAVGVLVFVGVFELAVDDAHGVFRSRFLQHQDDHAGGEAWRSHNRTLAADDGVSHRRVGGGHERVVALRRGLCVGFEFRGESIGAAAGEFARNAGVQLVARVFGVGLRRAVLAEGEQRVPHQQVTAHQPQVEQVVGVRLHGRRHGWRRCHAAAERQRRQAENGMGQACHGSVLFTSLIPASGHPRTAKRNKTRAGPFGNRLHSAVC